MNPDLGLDRAAIAARIPHQGNMCLLDRVLSWDAGRIHCRASSHHQSGHPLANARGGLPATAGIEYAAQAMAVHGALQAGLAAAPRVGYLTSLRSVSLRVARLDDQPADLDIEAEQLSADTGFVLYGFTVSAAGVLLLQGRASVILNGDASPFTQGTAS